MARDKGYGRRGKKRREGDAIMYQGAVLPVEQDVFNHPIYIQLMGRHEQVMEREKQMMERLAVLERMQGIYPLTEERQVTSEIHLTLPEVVTEGVSMINLSSSKAVWNANGDINKQACPPEESLQESTLPTNTSEEAVQLQQGEGRNSVERPQRRGVDQPRKNSRHG